MNLNSFQVENFSISLEYYNFLKKIENCIIDYIQENKTASEEYYKRLFFINEIHKTNLNEIIKEIKTRKLKFSKEFFNFIDFLPKLQGAYLKNLVCINEDISKEIEKNKNLNSEQIIPIVKLQYDNSKKDLIKKENELKKVKKNLIDSMRNIEANIYKYFSYKKENKNEHKKENKKNKNILTEEVLNNNIANTKAIENIYKNEIEEGKKLENNFIKTLNFACENVKNASTEVFDKLKHLIINFVISLKNKFKLPLSEIDLFMPDLIAFDKSAKITDLLEKNFHNNKNIKNHIIPEKYNLEILKNKDAAEEKNNKNISNETNINIKYIEDGYYKETFIEDEIAFLTLQKMKENFELINIKDINLKAEKEKMETKKLTLKLVSNIKREKDINNNEEDVLYDLNEDEKIVLEILLNKHCNRVIFLHLLNRYRTEGKYLLPREIYNFISNLFIKILDTYKQDKDIFSAKNIIILSQTYFSKIKEQKIYLYKSINNHEIFKDSNFWEFLFNYEMNKEKIKISNIEMTSIINDELEIPQVEKKNKRKLQNLAYGQLMSLASNMKDFGFDPVKGFEIIEPKTKSYNLKQDLIEIIKNVLGYKESMKEEEKNNENIINEEINNNNIDNNKEINDENKDIIMNNKNRDSEIKNNDNNNEIINEEKNQKDENPMNNKEDKLKDNSKENENINNINDKILDQNNIINEKVNANSNEEQNSKINEKDNP